MVDKKVKEGTVPENNSSEFDEDTENIRFEDEEITGGFAEAEISQQFNSLIAPIDLVPVHGELEEKFKESGQLGLTFIFNSLQQFIADKSLDISHQQIQFTCQRAPKIGTKLNLVVQLAGGQRLLEGSGQVEQVFDISSSLEYDGKKEGKSLVKIRIEQLTPFSEKFLLALAKKRLSAKDS